MKWEVVEDRRHRGEWRVEAVGEGGECYGALFWGPGAELRARRYAQWVNGGWLQPDEGAGPVRRVVSHWEAVAKEEADRIAAGERLTGEDMATRVGP